MTDEEWLKAAKVLQDTFPHTPVGVKTWFQLLRDLDGAAVLAAIIHLCRTTEAFPSVAAIRKLAEPKPLDAADAWGEFIAAIKRVGYTGTPQWSSPVVGQVVEQLGGWLHVCQTMQTEHEPTWRAQFRRAFEATAERAHRDQTFTALGMGAAGPALASGETEALA